MDWQIIISLITLALVIFTIVWGTGLWARREKVKIKITSISYGVNDSDGIVKVYWGGEFKRSGRDGIRYITQILLKPDGQKHAELQQYFSLPQDGVIRINERLELPRHKIVSSGHGDTAFYPDYDAFKETKDAKKWKIVRQIASELGQDTHEIALVWEDKPNKIKWKAIRPADYGQWREV